MGSPTRHIFFDPEKKRRAAHAFAEVPAHGAYGASRELLAAPASVGNRSLGPVRQREHGWKLGPPKSVVCLLVSLLKHIQKGKPQKTRHTNRSWFAIDLGVDQKVRNQEKPPTRRLSR